MKYFTRVSTTFTVGLKMIHSNDLKLPEAKVKMRKRFDRLAAVTKINIIDDEMVLGEIPTIIGRLTNLRAEYVNRPGAKIAIGYNGWNSGDEYFCITWEEPESDADFAARINMGLEELEKDEDTWRKGNKTEADRRKFDALKAKYGW